MYMYAYLGFRNLQSPTSLGLGVIEVAMAMEGHSNQLAAVKATSLEVLHRMYAPSWKAKG